jgi:hypothetical protein
MLERKVVRGQGPMKAVGKPAAVYDMGNTRMGIEREQDRLV